MQFDEVFIRRALSNVSILFNSFPVNPFFSIDSRTIKEGEVFVALAGAQCDGHDFIQDAIDRGAAAILICTAQQDKLEQLDQKKIKTISVVVVPDTLNTLFELATQWRAQFSYPVIGITGSVGKTSTKELIATILTVAGKKYLVSHGNQNTRIGTALNLLKMRKDHEVAVFEMGISCPEDMRVLANMVRPTIAVITAVGHSHMEGLGSLQDIALAKRDIFRNFTEENIGIIHGDQPLLSHVSYHHPVVKFGFKTTNQIQARKIRMVDTHARFVLKLYKEKYNVVISKPHMGAVSNTLAAATVGYILKIPSHFIIEAIQKPQIVTGRFERCRLRVGSGYLINDCYNANPESMKAALLAFEEIDTPAQKVAVIGDMLELGVNSPFWHRQIGRFVRKVPTLKKIILVGSMVEWTKKTLPMGLEMIHVPSWQEAVDELSRITKKKESMVLVKGSLGMGLLNLVKQCT